MTTVRRDIPHDKRLEQKSDSFLAFKITQHKAKHKTSIS